MSKLRYCPSCLQFTCVTHPGRKWDRECIAMDCGFITDLRRLTVTTREKVRVKKIKKIVEVKNANDLSDM